MKKSLLLLSCFLLMALCHHAQSVVSCNPNWASPGSSITVTVTGAGVDFTTATTYALELQSPQGSILSFPLTNIQPNTVTAQVTIPTNAVLGNYGVAVPYVLFSFTPNMFSVLSGPPGSTGLVSGHVYHDLNNNCVQDGVEGDLANEIVQLFPGPYYAVTNNAGDYAAQLPPGSYTVHPTLGLHEVHTCSGVPVTATLGAIGQTVVAPDIGVMMLHVTDGGVACSVAPVRPGFDQYHTITVSNLGYYPLSGQVKYILDSTYTYLSSNPGGTVSGDTVTWNLIPPILQGASRNFAVETNCPIPTPLGTQLTCTTVLLTDSTDANAYDNSSTCPATVVGSYDPNDKMVWNQDMVPADPEIHPGDSVLVYRIRFQNTGTASAVNIVVRDTLDTGLDPATVQNLSSSHGPPAFTLSGDRNMQWSFPNIQLPDSNTNEPRSHGYILYSVKLKPGVGIGETIRNTASIYFDFNAPVVTNTTQSSIVVGAVEPMALGPIRVYPNPVSRTLYVDANCGNRGMMTLRLFDSMGKMVGMASSRCDGGTGAISVEALSPGIYFLRASQGTAVWLRKVVVMD